MAWNTTCENSEFYWLAGINTGRFLPAPQLGHSAEVHTCTSIPPNPFMVPAVTTLGEAAAAAPAPTPAPAPTAPAIGGFRLVATKLGEFKSGRLFDATIGGAPAAAAELLENKPLYFNSPKRASAPTIPRPIAIPLAASTPLPPEVIAPAIIRSDIDVGAELIEG